METKLTDRQTDRQTDSYYSFVRKWLALKRAVWFRSHTGRGSLSGARVFGDGLGSLADGVLSELTGQKQTDGGLDLAARDGRTLVVVSETRRLGGDALEDVVDKRIHDAHCLARDTGVGMYLLQHLVDVDSVALPPSSSVLLVPATRSLLLADGLLGALRCCFRRHGVRV